MSDTTAGARRGRIMRQLSLAAALLLAASASHGIVTVSVGPMTVDLDPIAAWSIDRARYEGEFWMDLPAANGTAVRAYGRDWAGENHYNLIVERIAVYVDGSSVRLPTDGDVVVADRRVRVERQIVLDGVARLSSVIVVSTDAVREDVTLRLVSHDRLLDFPYIHLGTRANGFTEATALDRTGNPMDSWVLDQDDYGGPFMPVGTVTLLMRNPVTGLNLAHTWPETREHAVRLFDRTYDQKLYVLVPELADVTDRVWSSQLITRVWRQGGE